MNQQQQEEGKMEDTRQKTKEEIVTELDAELMAIITKIKVSGIKNRALSLVFTKMEEAYMWLRKADEE